MKNKKNFDIQAYMAGVEKEFSAVGGHSNFDDNTNLDLSFDANQAEQPQVQLKQAAPYQVTVTSAGNVSNPTGAGGAVVLFGHNLYAQSATFGSAAGITVTPAAGVSYLQLLTQSMINPFETSLIRISGGGTNANLQALEALSIHSTDASGQSAIIPIYPTSYISPMQNIANIIDIPFNVKIDGNNYITFTLLANASVTLNFFPMNKVNGSRSLNGQASLQQYATPNVPVASMPVYVSAQQMKQLK